jgi:hypothetical protein
MEKAKEETFELDGVSKLDPTGSGDRLFVHLSACVVDYERDPRKLPGISSQTQSQINISATRGIIKFCGIRVRALSRGCAAESSEAIWWYTGDFPSAILAAHNFLGTALGQSLADEAVNELSLKIYGCSVVIDGELNLGENFHLTPGFLKDGF